MAERRFGWGRDTVEKGLHEAQHGVRLSGELQPRKADGGDEDKDPQLAADIRAIVEPHVYAGIPNCSRHAGTRTCRPPRCFRDSLDREGPLQSRVAQQAAALPRDILNRMNYRLKRIQKGKPLKKTEETDAIFANVKEARAESGHDPEVLEISMDTKAKVSPGSDLRPWGKNPDRRGPVT